MKLNYDLIIKKIDDEDGTFFRVFTRELDDQIFYGIGETIEEAINSFNEAKESMFSYYFEQGHKISEPMPEEDEVLPSGKFLLRISPYLHQHLLKLARTNKQSLNYFINSALEQYTTKELLVNEVQNLVKTTLKKTLEEYDSKYNITDIQVRNKETERETNESYSLTG